VILIILPSKAEVQALIGWMDEWRWILQENQMEHNKEADPVLVSATAIS
jgi:hypothetical protein